VSYGLKIFIFNGRLHLTDFKRKFYSENAGNRSFYVGGNGTDRFEVSGDR